MDATHALDEYGRDLPEDRHYQGTVSGEAIRLVREENWESAEERFREAIALDPDYDLPYFWTADLIKRQTGAAAAIEYLKGAAKVCRRKHLLLAKAAEMSLLEQAYSDSTDFVDLFAQAMGAFASKPDPQDVGGCRPFQFWAEICEAYSASESAGWAERLATNFATRLTEEMKDEIRSAIHPRIHSALQSKTFVSDRDRVIERNEALAERFPA